METAAVAIVRRKGRERGSESMLKDEVEVKGRSKSTCKRLLGPTGLLRGQGAEN